MHKKKIAVMIGILICSLIFPVQEIKADSISNSMLFSEISPTITVSEYVDVTKVYARESLVEEYYRYSFYHPGYRTTLYGTLVLYGIMNFGTRVEAYYSGYCSGSI